jgi:AraC-like DNA-binding protein
MTSFVSIVFNVELTLMIGVATSFVLGFLLLLIKVPNTEYSLKIAKTKNTIAVCFFICSILMYSCLRFSGTPDYDKFSSLMMFTVTAISSAILSFALINVLDDRTLNDDKFYLNVGLVAVLSVVMVKAFWWENQTWRAVVFFTGVALFLFQCISHILVFDRVYRESVRKIEQYYDEEEDHRLKSIRFCYAIMMLTQMFILVYMLLPSGIMKVYILWYSLYLLYFSANFISFLGSHKLLLDAFAYKTLSGQDLMQKIAANRSRKGKKGVMKVDESQVSEFTDVEFKKLEKSLERWVSDKSYREYDKSRDDIVRELGTTKEMLHLYFATVKGKDFKTWRTELRIEEAKKLLLEKRDVSVNIIGEVSGFSDRSNFHRQFVKIVGCSPKQWRETNGRCSE